MKPVLALVILVALCGCRTDSAALSNVYPGYLGAQGGYAPAYVPYRAPVTTRCTTLGIDGERLLCQSY